jgi:hypothetical protein
LVLAGAFALITGGRVLAMETRDAALSTIAFLLISTALGAAALRWGTTSLHEWREIQSVFGSPVILEPQIAAIGCGLAAAAGTLGLVLWLSSARIAGRGWTLLGLAEAALGSAALVTAFWGPGVPDGEGAAEIAIALGRWVGATLVLGAGTYFLGRVLNHRPAVRWIVAGTAFVLVVVALSLLASEL